MESSVKGAIGEIKVIGEFLRQGFDVYRPIVDRGIDAIIRSEAGQFFEIQIKTRHTAKKTGKYWFEVRHLKVRPNFFIVLYQAVLYPNDFWVIPSAVFKQCCRPKKEVCVLQLNPKRQRELRKYKNNFQQFISGNP